MAEMLSIPILGIVENMAYFECPDCHGKHNIFGESRTREFASGFGIDTVAQIPLNPALARACDKGEIESFTGDYLNELADKIEKAVPVK